MRRQIETRQAPPVIEAYEVDDRYPTYYDDKATYITVHPPRRRVRTSERYQGLFLRGIVLLCGAVVILFLIAPQAMLANLFERISYIFLALLVGGAIIGWVLGAWEFFADLFRGDWMQ
jgi:hypothetical protein